MGLQRFYKTSIQSLLIPQDWSISHSSIMTNKMRVKVVEDCLRALEHDVHETKESIQLNHDFIINKLLILLKLMKEKEIDEEKVSIYNNDDENYDESNFIKENITAIMQIR